MREKIALFGQRMKAAVWSHPVEVLLSACACVMGCCDYESEGNLFDLALQYMPVVFLLAYTLNRCCAGGRRRLLYYSSALLWIPFLVMPGECSSFYTHSVSLVIAVLVYWGSGWVKDNRRFVENALFFVRSLFFAGGLSLVIFLLAGSIFQSIQYIFEIWQDEAERAIAYTGIVVSSVVFPLLFLMFNEQRERAWLPFQSKLFDMLLNYVLSPALLIYAVILYLYFMKIVVLWSLPKGAVALIVISFTSAAFLLKGCQVFLVRRYYDWFYNHVCLVVLPTLVMFWVGTLYRIREYGFTEPRVYLVVVGLILTGTVVLFSVKRWASYLYVACWAVFLLAIVTYIPGMTAKDIGRISQMSRKDDPKKKDWEVKYIHIYSDKPVDIRGYNTLESLRYSNESDVDRFVARNDTISVYDEKEALVYQESYDTFWDGQLRKVGLSRQDSIPESVYPDLLRIDLDSSAIILEAIDLRRDSINHINYITGSCYLKQ